MDPATEGGMAARATTKTSIRIVRTPEKLEALRDTWRALQTHPNADFDYFQAVVATRDEVIEPFVLVYEENNFPRAFLVGRVEQGSMPLRLGYLNALRPRVRSLTFVYGGALGALTREVSRTLVAEVKRALARGEASVAYFNRLRADSDLASAVLEVPGLLWRDSAPESSLHWRTKLHGSYDAFYQSRSKNTRQNMRRYPKRFQERFGDKMQVHCRSEPEDTDVILSECDAVARKTYHRGLGVGFSASEGCRVLVQLGLEQRAYRSYVLAIDGEPCAFWNGLQCDGTFYTDTTGYDPAFQDHRPGLILLLEVIRDLCERGDTTEIDFGFGDAQYKRSFCDRSWEEVSIRILRPTPRILALRVLATLVSWTVSLLRRVLAQRTLDRIKKRWRARKAAAGEGPMERA